MTDTVVAPHARAAADRLLDAARTATPCAPVRDLLPDGELATGHAVQSLLTRAASEQGRRPVGRKIGLTAPTVQAQLGVDRPDIGSCSTTWPARSTRPDGARHRRRQLPRLAVRSQDGRGELLHHTTGLRTRR
jgi:2-keto-4-pentenoate hydratase